MLANYCMQAIKNMIQSLVKSVWDFPLTSIGPRTYLSLLFSLKGSESV